MKEEPARTSLARLRLRLLFGGWLLPLVVAPTALAALLLSSALERRVQAPLCLALAALALLLPAALAGAALEGRWRGLGLAWRLQRTLRGCPCCASSWGEDVWRRCPSCRVALVDALSGATADRSTLVGFLGWCCLLGMFLLTAWFVGREAWLARSVSATVAWGLGTLFVLALGALLASEGFREWWNGRAKQGYQGASEGCDAGGYYRVKWKSAQDTGELRAEFERAQREGELPVVVRGGLRPELAALAAALDAAGGLAREWRMLRWELQTRLVAAEKPVGYRGAGLEEVTQSRVLSEERAWRVGVSLSAWDALVPLLGFELLGQRYPVGGLVWIELGPLVEQLLAGGVERQRAALLAAYGDEPARDEMLAAVECATAPLSRVPPL